MNNPDTMNIDIADQRAWLIEHKATTGKSWFDLGRDVDIKHQTLSLFATDNYRGNLERIAKAVFRFRQQLAVQAEIRADAPDIPGYFETPTSKQLGSLLAWSGRGRMVLIVGGPGIGKSITAEQFAASFPNVVLVVAEPSMKSLTALCYAVLHAMGDYHARPGNQLANYTLARLKEKRCQLIVDEAQHLSIEQLEQLRIWYDKAKIGVAIMGNATVASKMTGGIRRAEFAQLYSRVAMQFAREVPLAADIEAMADAWRVQDAGVLKLMLDYGQKPGGLRGLTFAMEVATMLARQAGEELGAAHLRDAWSQLTTRPVLKG